MLTLGIDIGSTTSKCAIMRDGNQIVASSILAAGIGTLGVEQALEQVHNSAGVTPNKIEAIAVTGYGRTVYKGADYDVSELSCHAIGGRFVYPELRTVIDIGGQDAKVIQLSPGGKMQNFLMNDKCAAGTGRFLDVMANILQIKVDELGPLALEAEKIAPISSTCTVFAESEVISQLSHGEPIPNVVAGICESVAVRVAAQAKRVGIVEQVCLSGGVSKNVGVARALERILGVPILVSEQAQLFGAIGAAIYAYEKKLKETGGESHG